MTHPDQNSPTDAPHQATEILTAEEASRLPAGQWVIDADGNAACLINTHFGRFQPMWLRANAVCIPLTHLPYPVELAELTEPCPHTVGTNECGHCYRCGAVVEAPRLIEFNPLCSATRYASTVRQNRKSR